MKSAVFGIISPCTRSSEQAKRETIRGRRQAISGLSPNYTELYLRVLVVRNKRSEKLAEVGGKLSPGFLRTTRSYNPEYSTLHTGEDRATIL
jgi:hypothetical protein